MDHPRIIGEKANLRPTVNNTPLSRQILKQKVLQSIKTSKIIYFNLFYFTLEAGYELNSPQLERISSLYSVIESWETKLLDIGAS